MSTKKRLVTNFLSLASMQGLNMILPLITLPYLLRVVGPTYYGLINVAQAVITYFILFTDYGFNLIATRQISIARENKKQLSIIYSSVMAVRLVLIALSLVVLTLLVLFIPILSFQTYPLLYFITFGMVIGNSLFPVWFFQGMENMKTISILNLIAKLIFTFGIFIFVKGPQQYLNVASLTSLGYLVMAFISNFIIIFRYKIKIINPSKEQIKYQLREGWSIFLSSLATSVYTNSPTVILSLFAGNTIVGYYAAANKIITAVTAMISPIIQTVYPYLSRAIVESKEKAISFVNKIFLLITFLMGIAALMLGVFAKPLITLMFGNKYIHSIGLIQILSVLPLILGWAYIFGQLTMINFNYKQQLSRIYVRASFFSIVIMFILIPVFKQYGTAWTSVLTEAFATSSMFFFLWKNDLHIWKLKRKNDLVPEKIKKE